MHIIKIREAKFFKELVLLNFFKEYVNTELTKEGKIFLEV